MKTIRIIMCKELYRVFSDKKLVVGLFIMPAVLVIGLYFLMGIMATSMMQDIEAHEAKIMIYQAPQEFKTYLAQTMVNGAENTYETSDFRYSVSWAETEEEVEQGKTEIYSGDLDLIIVFPQNFETQVQNYEKDTIPDIHTFYNPSEDYSDNARENFVTGVLEPYRTQLLENRIGDLAQLKIFSVDAENEDSVIQNDNKAQGKLFGYMIPYMITILLFAGAMNLGTDSFAGEKERGTMAALLMTPISRREIVYGKLFALMILSGLSALIYGGAMIFALPLLYRTMGAMLGQNLSFSAGQMAMLLLLIVTLVFLYVALIAVCATFAKNIKEASTYVMPVYMIVMVIGVMSMFKGENVSGIQYLIPLYGPTMALKNIFTLDLNGMGFLMAVLSNLVTGAICAGITAKMFRNEKIMFNA